MVGLMLSTWSPAGGQAQAPNEAPSGLEAPPPAGTAPHPGGQPHGPPPHYGSAPPHYESGPPPYYGAHPQQPMYSHRPRMHRVPYEDGMPIPPGAQVVERSRPGLWIPGLAIFGGFWLTTALAGASIQSADYIEDGRRDGAWRLYLPVLGPVLFRRYAYPGARPWLVMDTMVQAGGLVMFMAGLLAKRRLLVYYAEGPGGRSVALSPVVGLGTVGATVEF
jgi:hypothetical protein